MKASLIGLLTFFAIISIFKSQSVFVRFKLNPPNQDETNVCRKFGKSILNAIFTNIDNDINCYKLAGEAFKTVTNVIKCDHITDYPNFPDIEKKYAELYDFYMYYRGKYTPGVADNCKNLQIELKKKLVPEMLIFWTTLESLSFFWLDEDDDISGKITKFETEFVTSMYYTTLTTVQKELKKNIYYSEYNQDKSKVNVILEYSQVDDGKDLDVHTKESSMKYTEKKAQEDEEKYEIQMKEKDKDFVPEKFYLDSRGFFEQDTYTIESLNTKSEQFIAALSASEGQTTNTATAKIFMPTFRKEQLGSAEYSDGYLEQKYQFKCFDKEGSDEGKFIVNTIRIRVSPNGIGKVIIDGEIAKKMII